MYIYCQIRLFSLGGVGGGGYLLDTDNPFKSVKVLMHKWLILFTASTSS